MKEFEELDFNQIKELIEQKEANSIKEILADLHPADIAELCDELDVEEARFIYLQLDNETAAEVLTEMDTDHNDSVKQSEMIAYYKAHPEDEQYVEAMWNSYGYKTSWGGVAGQLAESMELGCKW